MLKKDINKVVGTETKTDMDKATMERLILEQGRRGPVFAAKFAKRHGLKHHAVQLAIQRLKRRGLIWAAMPSVGSFYGSTESGWKTVCDATEGCYRPHGHKGECAMKVESIVKRAASVGEVRR